ncbi:uncharacterized protein LOC118515431 [Anopheles stephensi]|uniref:uncharacterized protein LOC118515431 n=1 Tax=Anopheles stephensi TaxID=30069 RepID=UPI001658869E|nr:uncharacterized protein LOC118515431 [Anopheles stephensi]
MGRNVQPTIALSLSLLCLALLALIEASAPPPCKVKVTYSMMSRLTSKNRTEGDCAEAWMDLQSYLQQTAQNLTECLEREASATASDAAATACQPLFEQLEQESEAVRLQLNKDMQNKLLYEEIEIAKAKNAIARIKKEIVSVQGEFKGYYQQLLLIYIDAGDTRRALRLYQRLVYLKETNLQQTMLGFVYSSPKYENRRLENLLALVKRLPTPDEQMSLYRLIQPQVMNRTTQYYSFLGMIAALDMDRFIQEKEESPFKKLRDAMFFNAMKRWKFQMLSGNFKDVAEFARKYPDYYDKISTRVAFVQPQYWFKFSYSQFVTYPNLLPKPKHRLEAFREILRQVKKRNTVYYDYYLAKLAKQVDICEKYIKKQNNELEGKEDLIKLKTQFSEFDKKHDYEYYLKNVDKLTKNKPPLPANPNRPKTRGGLNGRR